MEIASRMDAGRKNTKGSNGIPAKGIHTHWPPQETMDGYVRPEQTQVKSWSNKNKRIKVLQVSLNLGN
jgi:hypothetical protein